LHIRCCVPYITVLPKWLLVFDGSNHRLNALPSVNFMLVGTSFTGPSFIVTVDVPLNVVELFASLLIEKVIIRSVLGMHRIVFVKENS